MKYLAAAVACATTACGSNAHVPHEVDLTLEPQIAHYLQYRDGDGPWQQPESKGGGTYALVVTDTYEVVAVFTDGGSFQIEELRATVDDPAGPVITRTPPPGSVEPATKQPMYKVSGTVVSGGSILAETPPGGSPQYTFAAVDGSFVAMSFDTSSYLYVLGNNNGLPTVVRRSFSPGQDANVGAIDVANEGRLYARHPVVIANAMGTPYVDIGGPGGLTLRDHSAITGPGFDMLQLPESMRQDGDRYGVTIATGHITSWQTYRSNNDGTLSNVELMSPITVDLVQYPTSATWAIDDRDAELDAASGTIEHHVHATAGWLAATGATSLAVDEDLPGFDPSWRLDPTLGHVGMSLTLSTSTATSVNSVTMSN